MKPSLRVVTGLLLMVVSVVVLVLLLRQPTLTYDVKFGEVAQVRCLSIDNPGTDGLRTGYVEIVEGSVRIETGDGGASLLGPEAGDEDANIHITTRAELTADCAAVRGERLAWTWVPGLGLVGGVALCWSARRRPPAPVSSGPPGPPMPRLPPPAPSGRADQSS